MSEEVVERELELHDPLDLVLVLAVGPKPSPHLTVQRRAVLISKLLGVDPEAEPSRCGPYSETITEKLQDARNATLFRRRDGKYELTPTGMRAYELLVEKLKARRGEGVSHFVEALHRINEKELLALTYHFSPELFEESEVKNKAREVVSRFKGKGLVKIMKVEA